MNQVLALIIFMNTHSGNIVGIDSAPVQSIEACHEAIDSKKAPPGQTAFKSCVNLANYPRGKELKPPRKPPSTDL